MRVSLLAFCALSVAVIAPSLTYGQLTGRFIDPTPDELKMTEDPKAPGADAVYLNVEETTNDELHYHSVYARIKILTEKGKSLATVEVDYFNGQEGGYDFERTGFQVTDIKGRTIHSDGTIVPLEGKPEDLLGVKQKDVTVGDLGERTKYQDYQVNRKVFNLPSVEVGSIIEYRYQVRYGDGQLSSPRWDVQKKYYVHKAHYSFTPFRIFRPERVGQASEGYVTDSKGHVLHNLVWWRLLPPGSDVKVDGLGVYSLDVADIPAAPDEDWMPPLESFLMQFNFYYSSATKPAEYWAAETKDWSKDVDRFAETSVAIKSAASDLIAPADSDLDKARKLYKAVQSLDNTDYSRAKGAAEKKQLNEKTAKHAEDIWAQKSGSSEDIALLYLAMLRAAGLNAGAMKVVDREEGFFNPNRMQTEQLDDYIVILNTGGKEVHLDPGEKMCPFQQLSWRHAGASGIRQGGAPGTQAYAPLSQYPDNVLTRKGDLTLDAQGAISGLVVLSMTGQRALKWRQYALRNDTEEVMKSFDRYLEEMTPEGVVAHVDHFQGLNDSEVPLIAVIKLSGVLGAGTAKRLILPGFFFESRGREPFVAQQTRTQPIDLHYPENEIDQVTYHLPEGLAVEAAPTDNKISWPNQAVLAVKSVAAARQISIVRQFAYAYTIVPASDYNDMRSFYQKLATSDQQQIVLARSGGQISIAPAVNGKEEVAAPVASGR